MVELAQWSRPIELCRICRILSSFCRALTYPSEYQVTSSRSPSPLFPNPSPSLMLICRLAPPSATLPAGNQHHPVLLIPALDLPQPKPAASQQGPHRPSPDPISYIYRQTPPRPPSR
ncbi:hypothetical protein NA56DRAFT_147948 [Hyaloscypha hepaticicola]|uniref:Uncharacterized protein n=1 Tax=Hyaloscypha hepaticicola TaxID=2082293 RepID=A0A2J6QNF3_9HELO|nr:hypothetical protein NA56DRAFT_147948 [Hyaloscypha hepaticicola]